MKTAVSRIVKPKQYEREETAMKFLFRKMIRSVRQFKLQFVSVYLLAMLSVVIYSGLEGIWRGIDYEFDSFANETALADEWVSAAYFTSDDVTAIENMKGVSGVSQRLRITVSSPSDDGSDTYLSLDTVGHESISSMKLISGKKYDKTITDSVWLDRDYAKENGIFAGKTIDISYNGNTVRATVAGVVMSAEKAHYIGTADNYIPEHNKYGYGFMSDDMREKLGSQITCNLLEIKSSGSDVKVNINELLGERFIAYYDRDTLFDVSFVSGQAENLKRVSIIFSSLFILLSVLSMRTTIKRLLDAQSSDITTLKSLGFSNRKLTLYYSLYGLLVSVLGTVSGYFMSFPFSKLIQRSQKKLISLPEWEIRHTIGSLTVVLLIIALSLLTSVLAARKALIGLPAESSNNKSVHAKTLLIERGGKIWNRLSFGMKWTLRDASVHKSRIMLGIISVCGSFMLLMIGSGTPDSIKAFTAKSYSEEFVYDYKLTLNTSNTPEQTASLKNELNGQLIQNVQSRITLEGERKTCFKPVTIFSDGNYIGLRTLDGSELNENGVYVTEGIADSLGIKTGDKIALFTSFSARSFDFTVDGIIPSGMPQTLYIGAQRWTDAGAAFRPSHLLCGPVDDPDSLGNDVRISQLITSKQQEDNLKDFSSETATVFMLMKIIAFALVVIVLYNLTILSFIERIKEYNTFRVLGFHFREICRLASLENVIILVIGTLAGIPSGLRFLELYCANFSNDTLKIYPVIKTTSLVIAFCIVAVCTVATIVLLSRRIRKIDMVQALKE